MEGLPVHLFGQEMDWPAWVQAVGSIAAILVSVSLSIWLQDRDRTKKRSAELANQVEALIAIGERCVRTLSRLDERARTGKFSSDQLGWLSDEVDAAEETIAAVDLMAINSAVLIREVAELQEAARTGRRRLGYSSRKIKGGNQPDVDQFEDPLKRAKEALAAFKQFKQPTS